MSQLNAVMVPSAESIKMANERNQYATVLRKRCTALAAADALPTGSDCLIKAYTTATVVHGLYVLITTSGKEKAVELFSDVAQDAFARLPAVLSALQGRAAAGKLAPKQLRPYERSYWSSHAAHLYGTKPAGRDLDGPEFGWHTYWYTATAAYHCAFGNCQQIRASDARDLNSIAFITDALKTLASIPPSICVVSLSGFLARMTGIHEQQVPLLELNMAWVQHLHAAWEAARISPAGLHMLQQLPAMQHDVHAHSQERKAAYVATHGRVCAVCAAREPTPDAFKLCGACRKVAYCGREHQLADWPSHKAACTAACEAASK